MYRSSCERPFSHNTFHKSALCLLSLCLVFIVAACASSTASSQSSDTNTPTPTLTGAVTPAPSVPAISTALIAYKGHSGPVIGVSWSPDGKRLATCGNEGAGA